MSGGELGRGSDCPNGAGDKLDKRKNPFPWGPLKIMTMAHVGPESQMAESAVI